MAWSETLGQVMQTRPILAYGATAPTYAIYLSN